MKIYMVGGAVRDRLLGLPIKDRDWVVVGATPEQLLSQGFLPVGRDFPVFLHPKTHEEYALARTERKITRGYHGFQFYTAPEVTLEEDLARRDLTINAMAQDEEGRLIDPYHGKEDLRAGLLRHVSPSFVEDPVRILRLARFAARFDFAIAPTTQTLVEDMVQSGEVNALVAERVWHEMAKALMSPTPSRFLTVLHLLGALKHTLPEIETMLSLPSKESQKQVLLLKLDQFAPSSSIPLSVRFALLSHLFLPDNTALLTTLCQRLRIPNACRELAQLVFRYHQELQQIDTWNAHAVLRLFHHTDALRRPERFIYLMQACQYAHTHPRATELITQQRALLAIDYGAIAQQCSNSAMIAHAIECARLKELNALQSREH